MSATLIARYRLRTLTVLRGMARRAGLIPLLSRARTTWNRLRGTDAYEARFDEAMMAAIGEGDVVWDIGANIGFYTERFSALVGDTGEVVAFEPVPQCFAELSSKLRGRSNVRALNLALGDSETTIEMSMSEDPLGSTHSLVGGGDRGGATVTVRVSPGDAVLSGESLREPNVVKIDVEGFEEEVIRGLQGVLRDPACRAVFCEVHFAILDSRGEPRAAERIESTLSGLGFRTRWLDASHLGAERGG